MYHVFICYPRTYLAYVTPLHDALELALRNIYRRDAEVFQDTSDLQALNQWESDVNTALEHARVMIVVVVPTILESPQCRREMLAFIDTPGKHIVPLICEAVPRMRRLAESVDDHPVGSPQHEIAVCARALLTWQAQDFSKVVYRNPTESAYVETVADLARMIRDKLDHEDHAADTSLGRGSERQRPAERPDARTQAADAEADGPSGDTQGAGDNAADTGGASTHAAQTGAAGGRGKPRRGFLVAAVVTVLAMGGFALWFWPTSPEADGLDNVRAQALLTRVLTDAAARADHLSFDAENGVLRIAAPAVGSAATRIDLQPGFDTALRAGFVPGFAEGRTDGEACFTIEGEPLILAGSELRDGEFVTLRLRLQERAGPQNQKTCLTARSSWRPLEAGNAVVSSGAILSAPGDDARQLRTLRRGQQVPGPFWTNNEVPGWVRMEYRGDFAYLRRDAIIELR